MLIAQLLNHHLLILGPFARFILTISSYRAQGVGVNASLVGELVLLWGCSCWNDCANHQNRQPRILERQPFFFPTPLYRTGT